LGLRRKGKGKSKEALLLLKRSKKLLTIEAHFRFNQATFVSPFINKSFLVLFFKKGTASYTAWA
jgi:hypothetical protein